MDDKLIEQIVKVVLSKLKYTCRETISINKKALLIGKLSECNVNLEKLRENFIIEEISNDSSLNDYEAVILPGLKCTQISAIWSCMPSDEITRWSIEAILSQKQLFVSKDMVQINDRFVKQGSNLYNRVSGYFEELKNDGLMYIDDLTTTKEIKQEKNDKADYGNRLLNEKQASKFKNKGIKELSIGKKTIITPLAKDLLRNFKIEIIQE